MIPSANDRKYIKHCLDLADKSMKSGDLPFGALVVYNGSILVEATNTGLRELTGHAEVNALKIVVEQMPDIDISECTLYTNFEPCAMCSYVIRDFGVKRVVFSAYSPHLGGYSKWPILQDEIRPEFTSRGGTKPPEVIGGVLEEQCNELFDSLHWLMHRK